MNNVFAQAVSFLFNPLFLSTLVPFLVIYKYTASGWYAVKWFLFTSVFIVGGTSYLLYGMLKGYFSDIDISKREQRPRFYKLLFLLSLAYLFISLFLKGYRFPTSILAFGIALAIITFSIANKYIKASGHVGVACAFVIVVGFLYGQLAFLGTVWIVPLLAWSRLKLKRHTMSEIIVGGLLGTLITLITFFGGTHFYYNV